MDDTIVKSDWKDGWFVRMGKNENNVNEATNEEHENEQTIKSFIWLSEYLAKIKKTSLTDLSCDNCGSWFSSETKVAL